MSDTLTETIYSDRIIPFSPICGDQCQTKIAETDKRSKKVGIFVDYENIQISFKRATSGIKRARIDYREMRKLLLDGRETLCKRAYSAKSYNSSTSPAINTIGKAGFKLILQGPHNHKQKGVDVDMAMDIGDYINDDDCDTIIIVSGDADFIPAVERAHKKGIIVIVASFAISLSSKLAKKADKVILLDKLNMVDLDPKALKKPELKTTNDS